MRLLGGAVLIRVILLTKISFLLKGVGGKISFHFLTVTYSQERALVGKSSVTFCPWFRGWLSCPARSPPPAREHSASIKGMFGEPTRVVNCTELW